MITGGGPIFMTDNRSWITFGNVGIMLEKLGCWIVGKLDKLDIWERVEQQEEINIMKVEPTFDNASTQTGKGWLICL